MTFPHKLTLLGVLLAFVSPCIAQFTSEARLVEVYATVHDQKGRFVDGLPSDRFRILDNGEQQSLVAFESNTSELSCAILLDTTGSMKTTLASVKNAVSHFIDEMRGEDAVAVYGFSVSLNLLQDFTSDKSALKRAVQRTRAAGQTALFDAIAQTSRAISTRRGKKVIVVFTDGDDNASVLHAEAAILRAKKAGVPVYVVAEGEALKTGKLLKQLRDISDSTGGAVYEAHRTQEVAGIFEEILADLNHTYMLVYRPPSSTAPKWRTIEIQVSGMRKGQVRGKEGYYPE